MHLVLAKIPRLLRFSRVDQASLVNVFPGETYHHSYSWLTRSHAVDCVEYIRVIRKFVKLDAGHSVFVGAYGSEVMNLETVVFSLSSGDAYH